MDRARKGEQKDGKHEDGETNGLAVQIRGDTDK